MTTKSFSTSLYDVKKLFSNESATPYKLLIALLIFNSIRPDRLFSWGWILIYFPIIILFILMILWAQSPSKVISNAQTKFFFGFIIVLSLGVLLARNKSLALLQFRSLLSYSFLGYLVTVQFIDTSFKAERYIRLFTVLSLFLGIMGVAHKAMLPIPALADENEFALLMNTLIPISYFLGQEATRISKKLFYYALTSVFFVSNIISFSRGGFIGLLSVAIYIFYKSKKKIAAFGLISIFAFIVLFSAPQGYWDRIYTINTEGTEVGTGRERVESWKAGWRMFLDNPIVGVGPMNFGIWLPDYYIPYGVRSPETMWGRVAHSIYATVLSETGLAGTMFFGLMLWRNYRNYQYIVNLEKIKTKLIIQADLSTEESDLISINIRTIYYCSLGYGGAMIAYLTTGAFISVLYYNYFWMITSFWVMSFNVAKSYEGLLLSRVGFKKISIGQNERVDTMA